MPQPRCPKCHTVVEPSWDWCLGCGYDPAGRRSDAPVGVRAAGGTWQAPLPAGSTVGTSGGSGGRGPATRVTTLVGPDAAQPQEMRDPDWIEHQRRRLPVPAVVGLVAVMVVALGALLLVTLLVLHRPIGTTGGGGDMQSRPIPPAVTTTRATG